VHSRRKPRAYSTSETQPSRNVSPEAEDQVGLLKPIARDTPRPNRRWLAFRVASWHRPRGTPLSGNAQGLVELVCITSAQRAGLQVADNEEPLAWQGRPPHIGSLRPGDDDTVSGVMWPAGSSIPAGCWSSAGWPLATYDPCHGTWEARPREPVDCPFCRGRRRDPGRTVLQRRLAPASVPPE